MVIEYPPPPPPVEYRVEFSARTGEYFRIWIVNLAFSILTLGIYSAWAKVRKRQYLYSHTRIDGDAFEYLGNPVAILKGRVIAFAFVATLYVLNFVAPLYILVLLVGGIFVAPWLLVRSIAFNAHNSRFRGLRFRFHGRYAEAFKIFILYGLVTLVTLGLGYFYLKTRLTEFIVRRHEYGATAFEVASLHRAFARAYGRFLLLGIAAFAAVGILAASLFLSVVGGPLPPPEVAWTINIASYVIYLGLFAYIRARVLNATWENATLGPVRFRCTLGARRLFRLYLENVAAIVLTAGLATPWAVVRTLRYRAENFVVIAPQGLDGLPGRAGTGLAATGEEIAEMLDVDFGL